MATKILTNYKSIYGIEDTYIKKYIKLSAVCMSSSSLLLGDLMMDIDWKPLFWLTFEQVS